jgi:hypothetical protein
MPPFLDPRKEAFAWGLALGMSPDDRAPDA